MQHPTKNDYTERINRVQRYIQEHLDHPLNLQQLANIASFSPHHFHRIFSAYVGESLNNYIRRIRLENAAIRLIHTNDTITVIALDAGYATHGAFSTAFRKNFQQTPQDFRKNQQQIKFDKAHKIQHEAINMNPETRMLPNTPVLYVREIGPYKKSAEKAWGALCAFAGPHRLLTESTRFIGISYDDPEITEAQKLRYDACITIEQDVSTEGRIGKQTIPPGRYAVFLHKGPYDNFSHTYDAIFSSWLPQSGKKIRDQPCLEIYLNNAHNTPQDELLTEICIPAE